MSRRKERLKTKKRDLQNFLHATSLSIDSYQGQAWYDQAGLEPKWGEFFDEFFEFNEVQTVEFHVGKSSKAPGRLYLIFRGSDEKRDWYYNLNPFPIALKKVSKYFVEKGLKGFVSRGWAKEFTGHTKKDRPILKKILKRTKSKRLKERIEGILSRNKGHKGYNNLVQSIIDKHKPKEVWFIGHSKGGPNAALPWAETVCRGVVDSCHCYQLSSPRWARISTHRDFENIVEKSKGKHFIGVIQCGLDPVPLVGPGMLGWRHVGKYYHVGVLRPHLLPERISNHAPHILEKYTIKRLNRKAYRA